LVDEFGGLQQAVLVAKERAGLPADAPVVVKGAAPGLLEFLGLADGSEDDEVAQATLGRLQALGPELAKQAPPEVRSHVQSLLPLFSGERVLAIAPVVFQAK
jgi:hypothetical protein